LSAKEQLIKKLCARWNTPLPQLAIQEGLRVAFPDLQELNPPIPLGRLAASRGVEDIVKRDLECDGIISITSKGAYLIQVNGNQPEARRRFTIGHELGHTFFFEIDSEVRERVRDGNLDRVSRFDPEESLCNYASAEILMPRRQFGTTIRSSGPSSEGLIRLGREFNVSIQAATRRLTQVLPLNLVVAQWEYKPETAVYSTNWVVGLNRGTTASRKRLTVHRDDPAFKFFHERTAYRGQIWISLSGPLDGYYTDLISWQHQGVRRILTMFVLEKHPERVFLASGRNRLVSDQMPLF
jgi:Zn-dependent peptidase ImmA (M78 family)